jgi:hypothetical protein
VTVVAGRDALRRRHEAPGEHQNRDAHCQWSQPHGERRLLIAPPAEHGGGPRRGGRHAMVCSLRYSSSGIVYVEKRLAAVRPDSGSELLVESGARHTSSRLQIPSDIQYPIRYSTPHQIFNAPIRYLSSASRQEVPFHHKQVDLSILGSAEVSCELLNETCCTNELINRSHILAICKCLRIHD